jgi:hypothetical protein
MRVARFILAVFLVLIFGTAEAQHIRIDGDRLLFSGSFQFGGPVSSLPASPVAGDTYVVTDGANATDCGTGSSTYEVICVYTGAAWQALLSDTTDIIDDTHIDWGTGAAQVSADDVPDGSSKIIPTATQESNWDTAYGWGNHASGGYLTSEVDGSTTNEINTITGDNAATTTGLAITVAGGTNITTAVAGNTVTINGFSNESAQDLVGAMVSSNTETGIAVTYEDGDGTIDFVVSESDPNALLTAGTDNIKDTHIDWGTGAGQVSADDIGDGSSKIIPSSTQETNWDAAYGWGNHASAGYLTSPVAIANGGTGQVTAQAAINALTAVSAATAEWVLTKDTATSNAVWKANPGAGGGTVDTTGTVNANEIAVFDDSTTLKALTESEFKTAYNIEAGVDFQAYDADLADLADGSLSGGKVGTGISGTNITTGTVADAQIASAIARDSEITYETLNTNGDVGTSAGQLAIGNHTHSYESSTSNDFDPDRLAGDTTDDNLVDAAIIDSAIARDTEVPRIYDVRGSAYAALGNDSNDDTIEIQTAIDAAEAVGGGTVFIPAGTYKVTDHDSDGYCLTITAGIKIVGAGREKTIIKSYETTKPTFFINTQDGVYIADMQIQTNGSAADGQSGIKVESSTADANFYTTVERCYITANYVGIDFDEAKLWTVENNHIGTNTYGLYIDDEISSDGGDFSIHNNTFTGNGTHVYQVAAGGNRVTSNKFIGATTNGYHMDIGQDWVANVATSVALFSANSFENNAGYDIKIETDSADDAFSKISIVNNEFYQGAGGAALPTGIFIGAEATGAATDISNVVIAGNIFNDSGINIGLANGVTISNNYFNEVTGYDAIIINDSASSIKVFGNETDAVTEANIVDGSFTTRFYIDSGDGNDYSELEFRHDGSTKSQISVYGSGGPPATAWHSYWDLIGNIYWRDSANSNDAMMTLTNNAGGAGAGANLTVYGDITVDSCTGCADYVFEPNYDMLSLDELDLFVSKNKQLPNMTMNRRVDEKPMSVTKATRELLEKTEEQALYILELHDRLKALEAKVAAH